MNDEKKKIKVEFAPGCFDEFDGTQEELDGLIDAITKMAESGQLPDHSRALTDQDIDELPMEVLQSLAQFLEIDQNNNVVDQQRKHKLN